MQVFGAEPKVFQAVLMFPVFMRLVFTVGMTEGFFCLFQLKT